MSKTALAATVGGVVVLALGVLWMLQGADLIHVRPVLCVSACKPIRGGSAGWFIVGTVTTLIGAAMIVTGTRHLHRR